jgi:hypothetical protein
MVRKMTLLLGLASALFAPAATRAQDDIIADQFYGSGVHRYFSGDLRNAHADFTSAIQAGSQDPRPYYFRGLAYLRMGRQYEATADFRKAADLESNDINGSFQVSKALERIQGQQRLQLERLRVQARAIAQQRQDKQRRERYAASRRFEAEQIQRAAATQDDAAASRATQPPAPDPFDEANEPAPLPGGRAIPFAGAQPADARPAARDAAGPDAVAAPPAAATTADDPFGTAPPAESTKVDSTTIIDTTTTPAEKPADTPSDPFGASASPAPGTPTTTTAPASTPADASDPFGAPTTTPPSGTDAPTAAASSTDPFGGGTSSPPAAGTSTDTDPFGAPSASTNANPAESSYTVTADRPLGVTPPANNAAAPAAGNSTSSGGGTTGGLFRALGRAVGLDAARGAAESAMQSLPIGRGSAQRAMPARGGARSSAPMIAPPSGASGPQMTPGQDDPFGATAPTTTPAVPAADPDDPFGPADATPAQSQPASPFGAPPAAAPPGATVDDPFQDDAVQPSTPAAPPENPFGDR